MTDFNTIIKFLRIVLLAPFVVACETPYDPLSDYEQVVPATAVAAPKASADATASVHTLRRGEYLVELLGCGTCHTDGALIGEPDRSRRLAGSRIGIAFTNPLDGGRPGIVFPANLTPDRETGLGDWSQADIAAAIMHGRDRYGRQQVGVMPWRSYVGLTAKDLGAITQYLAHLPPVSHNVPASVSPGAQTDEAYVHFGVYRSKALR